jgi:hypothetical protein
MIPDRTPPGDSPASDGSRDAQSRTMAEMLREAYLRSAADEELLRHAERISWPPP